MAKIVVGYSARLGISWRRGGPSSSFVTLVATVVTTIVATIVATVTLVTAVVTAVVTTVVTTVVTAVATLVTAVATTSLVASPTTTARFQCGLLGRFHHGRLELHPTVWL